MERWFILEVGQRKLKMSPEHLAVPENKEVLKKRGGGQTGECKRGSTNLKGPSMTEAGNIGTAKQIT